MTTHSLNRLLEDVNMVMGYPSAMRMRPGVLTEVRDVFRTIGIEKLCELKHNVEIEIVDFLYRIPEECMEIANVYSAPQPATFFRNLDNRGYKTIQGVQTGMALEYRESPLELRFTYKRNGTAYMSYYSMYKNEDDEVIIPEIAYKACLAQATYVMLNNSNNRSLPRWQERLIIQQEAGKEISKARGELNKTTVPVHRTSNFIR